MASETIDGPVAFAAALSLERLTARVNAVIAEIEPLHAVTDRERALLDALCDERDCECVTHRGAHWLHVDRMWRERNRELLRLAALTDDPERAHRDYMGYLHEEEQRLRVYEQDLRRALSRHQRAENFAARTPTGADAAPPTPLTGETHA